jgi:putative alpha-1,2-mannosidase
MGFYPVTAGVPAYTFGSPIFSKVTLHLDGGKTFVLDASKADADNKYIQSVKVNGKAWDKTWFSHDVLVSGGRVTMEMGDRPNKGWGVGAEAEPFSQGPRAKE